MPITSDYNPFAAGAGSSAVPLLPLLPLLPVLLNVTGMFADATEATQYTTANLLHLSNTSVFAVQAPTDLPFLADAIVDYKMATFWMDDMCTPQASPATRAQNTAMKAFIEGEHGHFDGTKGLYYVGWYVIYVEITVNHELHNGPP